MDLIFNNKNKWAPLMSLVHIDMCIWETNNDLFCGKCKFKFEGGCEVKGSGIFCWECFLDSHYNRLINDDSVLIRSLKDVLFYEKESIKDEARIKVNKSLRYDVLKAGGFKCKACGLTSDDTKLHVDHIIPVSKGGKATLNNLQVLCIDCNIGKSNKI